MQIKSLCATWNRGIREKGYWVCNVKFLGDYGDSISSALTVIPIFTSRGPSLLRLLHAMAHAAGHSLVMLHLQHYYVVIATWRKRPWLTFWRRSFIGELS